jgi:hypothetical protein
MMVNEIRLEASMLYDTAEAGALVSELIQERFGFSQEDGQTCILFISEV